MPIHGSGVALLIDRLSDLNFYDHFNRPAADAELWTPTLDGIGTYGPVPGYDNEGTSFTLKTGNVIDDDAVIIGDVVKNKYLTPWEEGFTTVTWNVRLSLSIITDISTFWGLLYTATANYAANMTRCCHFYFDPIVSANIQARSYGLAAEEVTDTGIPGDTDFHKYKIVWSRTSVLFYIDDVLVATHTVQIPLRPCLPHFLIRTEAAAAINMLIDSCEGVVT